MAFALEGWGEFHVQSLDSIQLLLLIVKNGDAQLREVISLEDEEWRCTAEGSDIIGRPNECDMLNIPIPGLGLMDAYIENWGIGTLGIPACGIHEAWHVTPPLMDSI
jgi:hypothetical protein